MTALMSQVSERASAVFGFVLDALRNPAADRRATLLVLAAILLVVAILALTVAIAIASRRERRAQVEAWEAAARAEAWAEDDPRPWDDDLPDESEAVSVIAHSASGRPGDDDTAPAADASNRSRRGRGLTTAGIMVLVIAAAWSLLGFTSAQTPVCTSCHGEQPHGEAAQKDPHRGVACVACHEQGNAVVSATMNVPARVGHFVQGGGKGRVAPYGASASSTCASCHSAVLKTTFTDRTRSLRVSHAEPLSAGAECRDCHRPKSGLVVSADTAGMEPCLRCHDDRKASSACGTCHLKDPAASALGSKPRPRRIASRLVPNPRCDGCHATTTCTKCHGIEMPHTVDFKRQGHARTAAIELWKGGTPNCSRCHYEGHRPCTQCHEAPFLAHGTQFREGHKTAVWGGKCTCHDYRSPVRGRNFCLVCHDTKPKGAVEAGEATGSPSNGALSLPNGGAVSTAP